MNELATPPATPRMSIADVERDTGIAKDSLRVWERRYGFPVPERDSKGERLYPPEHVQRLRLIRRLLDAGQRPNKVVPLLLDELERLLAEAGPEAPIDAGAQAVIEEIFALVIARQLVALRSALAQVLARQGLQRFIIEVMPGLLERIGRGWLRGEIGVPEEHMISEALQNQLRGAINALPPHAVRHPTVLLTSLPDEDHGLGLLMVEALLESEHANCLPLGLSTPLPDIVSACVWAQIEVVAISVSSAYAPGKALKGLTALRELLPPHITLWAGGAGAFVHRGALSRLPNTRVIGPIVEVIESLVDWRETRA